MPKGKVGDDGRNQGEVAVSFEDTVVDFSLHPTDYIIASASITGTVECARFSPNNSQGAIKSTFKTKLHKRACRSIAFGLGGSEILSGSKDKSLKLVDTSTGALISEALNAHEAALNFVLPLTNKLVASADEVGGVKIWDTSSWKEVMRYKENVDFISELSYVSHKKTLLAASGDGCLSIFDIRKQKPVKVSENQDEGLLSVAVVRNFKKAVVGTEEGVLEIFSWGDWGDCTDRFPGHPSSIDSICKIGEDTIATGAGDGVIRLIGLFPNRLIGVIGAHGDDDSYFPIERLQLCHDGRWLGSCSHGPVIRFWDTAGLTDPEGTSDPPVIENISVAVSESEHQVTNKSDSENSEQGKKKKRRKKAKAKLNPKQGNAFFSGID
ncbi:WD40-repeat-containing domain protein [Cladochytrium replicatum]|nr:WD40-repeat-containing domain protein [Cladochytrium replicatum]